MNRKYLLPFSILLCILMISNALYAKNSKLIVAQVLGQSITEEEISPSPIQMLLLKQKYQGEQLERQLMDYKSYYLRLKINLLLFSRFIKDNNIIAPTKDIENFKRIIFEAKNPKLSIANQQVAEEFVSQWYLNKKLYEKYRGIVIHQHMAPLQPVGAVKAFLKEQQKKGAFKINDSRLKEAYWAPYNVEIESSFIIPDNQVNFSKPWWEDMRVLSE